MKSEATKLREFLEKGTKLGIEQVNLKVNRSVLIDSVNNNTLEWQLTTTTEVATELQSALIKFKKNDAATEHICKEAANMFIQIAIISELFGASNVQLFIEDRLRKMNLRNKRIKKRVKKAGFQVPD